MKLKFITSAIALALATPAYSADIELNDVVVTATRIPQPREAVIADITIIEAEEIQHGGQTTLVELLQKQPGIEISNTGGAGKASGIFMRGTNTSHVVVLIDGVRLQSATLGTTTFENLPLNQIERIEILRGPATSLYGQDAIGGVIQIFTKKGTDKPKFYASAGYGTYDTTIAEAGVRGKLRDTAFAFGVSANTTDGFSALDTSNPNLNDNDGYRNLSVTGSLSHQIAEGHELGLNLLHSKGKTRFDNRFNIDPVSPAFDPSFSDYADLEQHSYSLFAKNKILDHWKSTLRVGQGFDEIVNYAALGPFVSDSRSLFRTKQNQISWQNDFSLPVGTLTLMYDKLEEKVNSTVDYKSKKRTNEGYVIGYLANLGAHSLHATAREDHSSSFGNNFTGGVGYGFSFNDHWRITASYGSAFKAPTFNDLYYPDFFGFPTSNPDLKPEKSDNVEASLRYQDNDSSASATVYENNIRNLIALDALTFVPFNVNKAEIQGMTIAGSQRWGNWELNGSADIQSPRDEETGNLLVRRANRHGKLNLTYTWQDWRLGAEAISSSARYNDSANEFRMGGYTLYNLTGQYKINADWTVQARANNIFNKNYRLALDGNPATTGFAYNTPGANLFVNIRYEPQ
ncbi:MAG TPA: TonB-dependent receptor [Methylophilus sp.]|nr:TonB-dependent receptor [Methylophilus sp.]HQQ33361.1 TonB-dependent receptor [Methylophilus sp.]